MCVGFMQTLHHFIYGTWAFWYSWYDVGGVLEPIPHIYRRKTGHKTESHMCYKKNSSQDMPGIHFFIHVLLSCVQLFVTLCTVAHQAPPSMGFPRQEYWSGLPVPSPGDLLDPGIEPTSFALADGFLTTQPPGKPVQRIRKNRSKCPQLRFHKCSHFAICSSSAC